MSIADTIQEEAMVDRLRAHLADLRESRAKTDVDRRALALLEFMVVQRATRQAHGTETHAARALAALKSAFDGEWSRGEAPLMAQFLYERGAVEPAALAEEQLRQLAELRRVAVQPDEQFTVTAYLAGTQWNHGRRDAAIRTLRAGLEAYRDAEGRVASAAQQWQVTLSGWLESVGSYREAEGLWLNELGAGYHRVRELWVRERLFELYRNAVLARADVSIGAGDDLYPAVRDRMLSDIAERTNESHAQQVVSTLCDLWHRAHERLKLEAIPGDARRFAFTTLPGILARYQYRGGQNLVGTTADCLAQVSGSRTTLEFLVVRAENEPRWLRLASQDFWSQHAWRLSHHRRHAKTVPADLESRVLTLVLTELREDLRTRQTRDRRMFDTRYGEFWREKRADFVRVALEHLAERGDTSASVAYAAEYLFRGLGAHEEALDALSRAYRRGLLELEARETFSTFLQERSRWAESLPIVAELVTERPGQMRYRVMEMRGYHGTKKPVEVASALERAVAWCRENERWNEPEVAELAAACLETALLPSCVELYDEAIALHVKSAPNRGVGDGTLSVYYRQLALAHSGLGNVDAAVDAAAGAIVSWGRSTTERSRELANLEEVLSAAEDLDAYVERLDATTAREGVENPIVRKALGKVYLRREAPRRATAQLRRALEAQPNDLETYPLLVRALSESGERRNAADALLAWARAAEYEVELYRQLGEAFAVLELADQAERAYTTIVEVMPNEAESHRALGVIRQGQERWEEAVTHWRHVMRVRSKEPEGYVSYARALIHLKRWDEARSAITDLLAREWPERHGDVSATARALLKEIPGPR